MTIQATPESTDPIEFSDFLANIPPGKQTRVKVSVRDIGWDVSAQAQMGTVYLPDVTLHCDTVACGGDRQYMSRQKVRLKISAEHTQDQFLAFACRNCVSSHKTYAVEIRSIENDEAVVFKYGEDPPFGPPLPGRLLKLAGNQREYLLKGRRCENQGLGIAAFAYYRRVVEDQKNLILSEIIRVSSALGAPQELLGELEAAKKERRFTQAIDGVKHGLPQALLVDGHNPLTLLHNALSEGLHDGTDGDCLQLATSIRIVLSDLVERLSQALKDDADLNKAIGRLLQVKQQPK